MLLKTTDSGVGETRMGHGRLCNQLVVKQLCFIWGQSPRVARDGEVALPSRGDPGGHGGGVKSEAGVSPHQPVSASLAAAAA